MQSDKGDKREKDITRIPITPDNNGGNNDKIVNFAQAARATRLSYTRLEPARERTGLSITLCPAYAA